MSIFTVITTKNRGEPAEVNELKPQKTQLQALVQLGKELREAIRTLMVSDWAYINIRISDKKGRGDD